MKYKWIVEFTVDPIWVADGFNLTDERALDMILSDLSYATSTEVTAKVIKAPSPAAIKMEQASER